MINPIRNGLSGGGHAFLVPRGRACRTDAGGDDQTALGLRQGADHRRLLRRGDDAICARFKRPDRAFQRDVMNIAGLDQIGIQIGAIKAGEDGDGQNLRGLAGRAFFGRAHDLRIAVHRQKIKFILGKAAHGGFDRRPNIEKLHVQKDAFAAIRFQIIGQRKAAAGQHAKADLVERHGIAQPVDKGHAIQQIWHIKGNDQAVICGHGTLRRLARFDGAGPGCQVLGKAEGGMIKLEVAVDDALGLAAAVAGGADRIEVCAALDLGGLTPSAGLMGAAAGCGVPCYAMIRPRAGGFCYPAEELAVMVGDIAAARRAGLHGVVFGALSADARLDVPAMQGLCAAAAGLGVTLHRAFDLIEDWRRAVDAAVDLGIERILTSGGALGAPAGAARLAEVMRYAEGRIIVMPGAGISAQTIGGLRGLPLREVHASCAAPVASDPRDLAMGFALPGAKRTDAGRVAALKAALQ